MFAGQLATGACVSFTVTVKLQVAVRPAASVAVQLTVVVPITNVEPLAGTHIIVEPGQLSLTVAVNVTTAEHWFGSLPTVRLAGQVATGGCVSLTATEKVHGVVLPAASVAVQVTRVKPTWKAVPLGGAHVMVEPGQLSSVVAV
jgi:hypothetical protein